MPAKVTGDSLLIHEFTRSLFIGLCSVTSNITDYSHSYHSMKLIHCGALKETYWVIKWYWVVTHIFYFMLSQSYAWFPYSCNDHEHRCKDVSDSVPSSFDIREHFDYNIASFTGIVINCSVSSSCNNDWSRASSFVSSCIANLNQRDMAKQLLTPLRLIARTNFSLKNYSFELLNLTGTVRKVELISTFTTAVCKSWNVND